MQENMETSEGNRQKLKYVWVIASDTHSNRNVWPVGNLNFIKNVSIYVFLTLNGLKRWIIELCTMFLGWNWGLWDLVIEGMKLNIFKIYSWFDIQNAL